MAKRTSNYNTEQKEVLLEFVKQHPHMVEGKFTKDFTFRDGQNLWQEVTTALNAVPLGGLKTWKQSRKV